ncbi:MAG: lipoprotein insertase outer membrane protein LolB [Zoogloeaceae bacterium]|jgi:outer membrane lipoprotein LolB|nr:lipoprotein insertase outer membrane protein LolB [Zoogloeaceae bacterium]
MPRRVRLGLATTATCLALLAGCAMLEPAPPSRPPREAIASFHIEGRIAVRRAEENFSAGIDWRHDAQSDEIVISGPLGQGLARLSARAGAALLETSDRKRYAAPDLESLSEQVFGARLPVSGLGRWALGRAGDGGAISVDAAGRPVALSEQGWIIEYLRYESEAPNALPALLHAQREDVEVRLVIDQWRVTE